MSAAEAVRLLGVAHAMFSASLARPEVDDQRQHDWRVDHFSRFMLQHRCAIGEAIHSVQTDAPRHVVLQKLRAVERTADDVSEAGQCNIRVLASEVIKHRARAASDSAKRAEHGERKGGCHG